LIGVAPERHLWARNYERDLRDVLTLQGEVARAIAQQIQAKLTPQERTRLAITSPVNPKAHEAYLKGQYVGASRDDKGLKMRLNYFKQAIQIDPTYAMAYVSLCDTYIALENNSILIPQEAYPKAKEAANKALELDDNLAEAHVVLSNVRRMYEWDWVGAERSIKRALEINPNSARAHRAYGWFLILVGKPQEALPELEKVKELDPMQPPWGLINSHWEMRQYDLVMEEARAWIEADPSAAIAHFYLGLAYMQKGVGEEAIAAFEKALKTGEPSDVPATKASLVYVHGMSGRKAEARKILNELLELSKHRYVRPYYIGIAYTGLGKKDKAFEWFEKAYDERSGHMGAFKADPLLDPLRSDPRYQDLLRRMNFPP
jgi:tetratricopeptide (TPR) repeat protein